ncbi:MAG TPA: Ppx/GppA phosphatase family protein, partial [Solirubrobacteraceae bacterium]|nr:Ppx/GppA phosphatase family protein [Solirubrobacteraceae bacterium]
MSVREERMAVVDLGSNSFRMVVFSAGDGWWKRSDEIHEPVRIGEGADESGELGAEPMARALTAIEVFAHFASATGLDTLDAVATSAIRGAGNRDAFLRRARRHLPVRVLSEQEEARYGYLAAVNSTSLVDGAVLDLGGGSLQLVHVEERRAKTLRSWPLGAVRMTERFLPGKGPASKKELKALRARLASELEAAPWLAGADRIVGIGGTVRNLAVATQIATGVPTFGVQGFVVERDALDDIVTRLADMTSAERAKVPGIKPARADLILAGAATIQAVLREGDLDAIEVTEAGLREGVFFESHLCECGGLFADVRGASVRNLAMQYSAHDLPHVEHVAELALGMFDDLVRAGAHPGKRRERELLWAAAMLHDIGVAIDYDDHHKHSRYLILNAGLPGYSQREIGLIAQIARYHRKGTPALDDIEPLALKGDGQLVAR